MAKYKPGDYVTVRSDLNLDVDYYMEGSKADYNRAVDDMLASAGKTVKILGMSGTQYRVEGSRWCWTDGMFESIPLDTNDNKSRTKTTEFSVDVSIKDLFDLYKFEVK